LTTKYVYDGQTVIGEIRSDGTKRWYVLGAMGYVCRIDEGANGEILARDYFVYDGLGSCRALVSSNGVVVAKYDYDVYGSVRGQEGQRANNFKYVAQIGHPTDEETGLIYMRARYYDPEIGRFVSEDPGQHGMNWFIYAMNNPTNLYDFLGKKAIEVDDLLNLGLLFVAVGVLFAVMEQTFLAVLYLLGAIFVFAVLLSGIISSFSDKKIGNLISGGFAVFNVLMEELLTSIAKYTPDIKAMAENLKYAKHGILTKVMVVTWLYMVEVYAALVLTEVLEVM